MSLKKTIRKFTAAFIAILLIYSNCYLCGLGISKAIAQDVEEPNIVLNVENSQYVQFKEEIKKETESEKIENEESEIEQEVEDAMIEFYSGVAVKTKLHLTLEEQEMQLPIKSSEIVVSMPALNGYLPERVTVVNANTILTTGETNNSRIKQNYDLNSGLLTISYQNEEAHSNYNKESKDEFEIIYIYPAEAYSGNEEEIILQYSVSAKVIFETENGEIYSELVQGLELTEKDNKGSLLSFGVTKLENNIYKGFMYSNVENGTNYDTDYNTVSTLCVLDSNARDNLTMRFEENKFVLNDEENTDIPVEEKIVYKATEISKTEFDKILGENGTLEIYTGEQLLATIKYLEVSENEELVKRLAIISSEENIKILSSEETIAKVEYDIEPSSLIMMTTKPISEGYMNFKNYNTIKASEDYIVNVEEIKSIKTISTIEENTENIELLLKEPETKISVNSSNINFSTLQDNKTTLTINLDDTNASTKLFDNPTIVVKLPEGLVNGNVSSPNIINGNGLEIKGQPEIGEDKNSIIIELSGKQTEYDLNNVSGGTSIVMDIENLDFRDIIPAHQDKITVTCIQNNEKIEANCNVNVISKAGLLVLSKVTGFDNNGTILSSMDNEVKTAIVETDKESREMVQTIDLVNNYEESINNIEIIGRLGYTGENLNSNFDIELTKAIDIENGKVYYSTNRDANYEDESWTEEFIEGAKAYKIEINNSELISKDNFGFKLYMNLPANLYYNQGSYIKMDINYVYSNNQMSDSTTFGILTEENNLANNSSDYNVELITDEGKNIPISVIVTPNITQDYVHSKQRVTYNIKVTNNGTEDLNNIVLEDIIPDNAIYTYEKEIQGNAANYTQIEQNHEIKSKTWNIEALKSGETIEVEIMLTMADVTEEQEISNVIVLKHNEQNITAESKLTLKPSVIETELITNAEGMINVVYNIGQQVQYYIKVKNIHEEKLKDIKVQFELPSTLEYVDGGLATGNLTKGYIIEEQGNINNNIFEYNIEKLKEEEEKVICIKAKINQLNAGYEGKITTIAKVNADNDIYESNIKTIKTKQSDYRVSLDCNVNEKTVLKKGNEVIYIIEVENIGGTSGSVKVKDSVPEQLKVKKVEEYINGELKQSLDTAKQNLEWISSIPQEQKAVLKIITEVAKIEVEKVENIEAINKATISFGTREITSNETKIIVQPELKVLEEKEEYNPSFDDNNKDEDNNNNSVENNKPSEDSTQGDNTNSENEKVEVYTISGVAWLDLDKNGKKNENETLLPNITVSLINMEIGNFATDSNGNKIIATTDAQGKYTFSNITKGSYAVMFEYDTEEYTVTTYQKEGVIEKENSNAILSTVNVNGEDKIVALTDKFELTSNKENIDLGLIENAIFDLSLNKQITNIKVVDEQGTESYDYENGHTAKVDLVAKYMDGANVIVNYKFTVTNEGEVAGYVNSLMDSLPSGLEFSSELNKNWYKDTDGNLYTTSLSGKTLNPGESIDVDLVLTKTMTEENAGTFVNSAKLEKISNLENIKEKEDAIENNESSAILIISIKTGTVMLYIGITTLCFAIIGIGAYFIKKKVLIGII